MFAINQATCQLGKISNNLEKHGDEEVPAWTIPVAGILIDLATLEALLHDGHASEAFFAMNPHTEVLEPRVWLTYAEPIKLTEAYDGMATTIKFGSQVLEFERSRLKDLVIGRFYPGMAQLDGKLQLYPGLDHENLVLQEAQNMPITLTVLDAKVAKSKKLRQQELPLGSANEPSDASGDADGDSSASVVGADDPLYPEALRFVLESRITSVDGVQIQFKIDQFRAGLLLAAMEDAGIVGPVRDDNSREILTESFEQPPDVPEHLPEDDEGGDDELDDDDTSDAPAPDPEPTDAGVWPMAAPGADELPNSRTGRAINAHAKRQARKRARKAGNGDARTH